MIQQSLSRQRLEQWQWKLDAQGLLLETSSNCFDRTQALNATSKHDTKQPEKTMDAGGAAGIAQTPGMAPAFATAAYGTNAPPFLSPGAAMTEGARGGIGGGGTGLTGGAGPP